jgi:hypothetical protein
MIYLQSNLIAITVFAPYMGPLDHKEDVKLIQNMENGMKMIISLQEKYGIVAIAIIHIDLKMPEAY